MFESWLLDIYGHFGIVSENKLLLGLHSQF